MEKKTKIIVLWLLTICGFASHSITDILPMFWGKNVAVATDGVVPDGMIAFMMLLAFFLPACAHSVPAGRCQGKGLEMGKCRVGRIHCPVQHCPQLYGAAFR